MRQADLHHVAGGRDPDRAVGVLDGRGVAAGGACEEGRADPGAFL